NTVQVNNQSYQAKSFILAVGTTPSIDQELKEKLDKRLITTDEVFELEKLPKSLAVIGSGVIAVELAQAMHRLGVNTHIFARSRRIGALSSPALQKLAKEELSKELNLHFETLPSDYQNTENGVELSYMENGRNQTLIVDCVMAATGRKTLLNTLKLQNIHPDFKDFKHLPVD
ncbi:SidA/IucD/PvdA family monooxygenase, partial [Escherichia coli]|uniref:FAD-dependent oxidoreductase n=1 Tax=Escherichia coli TaxID=562 RepID=UPI0011F3BF5A